MKSLRAGLSTFDYAANGLPAFKVRAYNVRGWSTFSSQNTVGATIETEPTQMAAVTRNTSTTQVKIIIDWIALSTPQNGYSEVSSYNLQWDKGTYGSASAAWFDLYGTSPAATATTFTLTSDITAGSTYYFRIRATNVHGSGAWSTTTSIKAAGIPNAPVALVTSIVTLTGKVRLDWVAPHDGS